MLIADCIFSVYLSNVGSSFANNFVLDLIVSKGASPQNEIRSEFFSFAMVVRAGVLHTLEFSVRCYNFTNRYALSLCPGLVLPRFELYLFLVCTHVQSFFWVKR